MEKSELLENLYMARALYSCWKTNESVKQKFIQEKQSKLQSLNSSIQKYNQQYNVEIKVLPNINWLYLIVPILLGAAAYGILVLIFNFTLKGTQAFTIAIWSWPIFVLLTGIITFFVFKRHIKDVKSSVKFNNDRWQNEAQKTDDKIIQTKNRIAKLEKNIPIYQENEQISNQAFNKFLETGFLYPTYRNIVAVCQFIQYLESGRAETLEGPYGCYNLFESEMKQNMIISKLDNIEQKLDRIERNQVMMYQTLKSIDNNARIVSKQLENMQGNIEALTACQAIIAGAELQQAATLKQIKHNMSFYYLTSPTINLH